MSLIIVELLIIIIINYNDLEVGMGGKLALVLSKFFIQCFLFVYYYPFYSSSFPPIYHLSLHLTTYLSSVREKDLTLPFKSSSG